MNSRRETDITVKAIHKAIDMEIELGDLSEKEESKTICLASRIPVPCQETGFTWRGDIRADVKATLVHNDLYNTTWTVYPVPKAYFPKVKVGMPQHKSSGKREIHKKLMSKILR